MKNDMPPSTQDILKTLCPWGSPGKNTGVGSPSLLQGIFPALGLNLGLLYCRQILYHLSHQGSSLTCSILTYAPLPKLPKLIQFLLALNKWHLESLSSKESQLYKTHAEKCQCQHEIQRTSKRWVTILLSMIKYKKAEFLFLFLKSSLRGSQWIEASKRIIPNKGGFPNGANGKEPTCQCRRHKRHGFDPWVGRILWRRAWQPTPVFLPGESHGRRNLAGYSPWGHKELDTMKQLGAHTYTQMQVKERGFPGGSVVKNPPAKQEVQVRSLGQEDPLEKEMATHSSLLAWKMPWTEEPGRSQSMGIAKTRLAIQQQQIKDREIIKLLNLCLIPQNCYLPSTLLGIKEWDLFSFGHCAAVHGVTESETAGRLNSNNCKNARNADPIR